MKERNETDFAWHLGSLLALFTKDDVQKYLRDKEVNDHELLNAVHYLKTIAKKAFYKT